jgi:hypothetical protein
VGSINLLFHQLKENGETTTVNSVHYLHQLRTEFMPALRRESDDLQTVWFQQDGATPRASFMVLK